MELKQEFLKIEKLKPSLEGDFFSVFRVLGMSFLGTHLRNRLRYRLNVRFVCDLIFFLALLIPLISNSAILGLMPFILGVKNLCNFWFRLDFIEELC